MSDDIAIVSNELEQLVVFTLADEYYGVDIGRVNGIERMHEITKVPRTADYVEGLINLRGKVIPVVDLRKVFYLPASEETKETRIVVVDIASQFIGYMVDAVTEVLSINADSVEPPPSVITCAGCSDYLPGIAKLENRMVMLLDLDKVLSHEQTVELEEMTMATMPEIQ